MAAPASTQEHEGSLRFSASAAPFVPEGEVIDFEGFPAGTILSSVFSAGGIGPVGVLGFNPDLGATNAAVIFDSANPTGEDPDLGTPHRNFGGPGIGLGGAAGAPYQNDRALGNLIIVAEDLVDANNDGLVDDPDDADVEGAALFFDFTAVGPVIMHGLTLIDVELNEEPATVEFFDGGGGSLGTKILPAVGDNGVAVCDLGDVAGVTAMAVTLNGSGAIDELDFTPEGSIGDFVWCDLNDDGVQDPGEPGVPGIKIDLLCAGPDGMFGTADDIADSTVTDANGAYLFAPLPPGACDVTLDVSSIPADKQPGRCPTLVMVNLMAGEAFLDADFCIVNRPGTIGDFVWCDLNDDGVQDPGEPGIPDVTVDLVCAGPDGMIGTADDLTASTSTDANGMYLFTGIPTPDTCVVTVDVSTALPKVPGRCPTTVNVNLGAGESFLDADFCFVEPPSGGGEGCTPGYWKQPHHFFAWTAPYSPLTPFADVFVDAFPGMTLLEVLSQGGGGLKALGRHTVAALLNAASPNVNYDLTPGEVIQAFNDVFSDPDPDYSGLKNRLEAFNEQGCPLGNGRQRSENGRSREQLR